MTKLSQTKTCPECGSKNVFYNKQTEELVCRDCGEIFTDAVLNNKAKKK